MKKKIVETDKAPQAIGPYSQAVKVNGTVYLSGQIPLHPETMKLVEGGIEAEIGRVFDNMSAVAIAAGGELQDIVKVTVYLTDLANFPLVNEVMANYFDKPFPARVALGVASLPMGANVELDAIMVLTG